ncbi:transcription antitermination regulator [Streptomyces albofaciens]|uniref:transcription antitermination regulator n=1 Tax=Streptomyces albofaciens TaxID=66866 RepID=UPI001238E494|nr:transcription antitermination regulator [Streptomyces albofaciens]
MPATRREVRIAEAVRDLVHRAADCDPLELLRESTGHTTALLPVAGAGVTVLDAPGRVEYATAFDERHRHVEDDQTDLDEVPCEAATRDGTAVPTAVRTGPAAMRRPRSARRAHRVGTTAVAAVPLRSPVPTVCALNLMGEQHTVPLPDGSDLRIALALARCRRALFRPPVRPARSGRPDRAADRRPGQAPGDRTGQGPAVRTERLRISLDDAFHRLRAHARARRRQLTAPATDVAHGTVPDDVSRSRQPGLIRHPAAPRPAATPPCPRQKVDHAPCRDRHPLRPAAPRRAHRPGP